MKKIIMPALIIVIIIQLLVPICMIADQYDILKNGEEYKFEVRPVDPYDAFRGRYVWVNIDINIPDRDYSNEKYGVIAVHSDGYAYIKELTEEKPLTGDYIESKSKYSFSMPSNRYYMDEKLAPQAEKLMNQVSQNQDFNQDTYAMIRVKNGKMVISGVYIDGVPIEDVIKKNRDT